MSLCKPSKRQEITYHDQFPLHLRTPLKRIIPLAHPLLRDRSQCPSMQIRREITHPGTDPFVERATKCEMAAEAHARCADAAGASGEREEIGEGEGGVVIVRMEGLFDRWD